ncbi:MULTISPECIES: hypothetical protein [unclassified Sphingobacterium]|uniref:hypothetical protein n=1 Tax=unclassified Sphingobacterium TaxID=2609468 RepID=UPI0025CF0F82|nr:MULTISPECIES: hypothetical protein [unclassified Sphingobacterium]
MRKVKTTKRAMFAIISVCTILFWIACKGNDLTKEVEKKDKIDLINNELRDLNNQFITKHYTIKKANGPEVPAPNEPKPFTGLSFKRFCAVFSNDVAGAWAGTWAGGKIGGLAGTIAVPGVGTVSGAAAGAVAGGVIVGAAASYGASGAVSDTTLRAIPMVNNPLAMPAPIGEESAYNGHNRVLAALISPSISSGEAPLPGGVPVLNPGVPTPSPGGGLSNSIFDNVQLTNNETAIVSQCQNLINTTISTFSNIEPSVYVSKSYVNSVVNDSFLTTVSNNFFDGLNLLYSKDQVENYIASYEQYVIGTGYLNQQQKEAILIALDASRGSLNFWLPVTQ